MNEDWILISEKLPESGEIVLLSFKEIVRTGYYFKTDNHFYRNHNNGEHDPVFYENPVAWKHLPEPYNNNQ